MSDQQQPTPAPFPTADGRAARALAIAGRSPVILRGMDDTYRDRLAELVSEQGEAKSTDHIEQVRLVVLDYHESKKASVDEDDDEDDEPETPKTETPKDPSPAVDPPAATGDTGSADPPRG